MNNSRKKNFVNTTLSMSTSTINSIGEIVMDSKIMESDNQDELDAFLFFFKSLTRTNSTPKTNIITTGGSI